MIFRQTTDEKALPNDVIKLFYFYQYSLRSLFLDFIKLKGHIHVRAYMWLKKIKLHVYS